VETKKRDSFNGDMLNGSSLPYDIS